MEQPSKEVKLSRITQLLLASLAFLTFTQTAINFWPDYANLYGVRIDYFSPALYLTDIITTLLLINFLVNRKNRDNYFTRSFVLLFLLTLCFALLNSALALSPAIALWKWGKFFLLIFLFRLVTQISKIAKINYIVKPLLFSVPLVVGIGLAQIVIHGTTGFFYLFGERTFTLTTPNIASRTIFGIEILRAYSTFSHPNSLAGFLLIGLALLLYWHKSQGVKKSVFYFLLGTTLLGIVISFSYSVWLYVLILFLLATFTKPNIRHLVLVPIVSFLLVVFAKAFNLKEFSFLSQSVVERLLQYAQVEVVSVKNLLLGVGLNNSILEQAKNTFKTFTFQPIHNGFLLLLVETGFVGLGLLIVAFSKIATRIKENQYAFLLLVTIELLFLFDHYQLTLQQNMLVSAITLGLIY